MIRKLIFIISLFVLSGCVMQKDTSVSEPIPVPEYVSDKLLTYTDEEYGFSFQYPERYIVDGFYLWLESRWRWHLDNPQINDSRHSPDIQIISAKLDGQELSDFINGMYAQDDYEFQNIGGRLFIKIVNTILDVTRLGYYTEQDDVAIGFVDLSYKEGDDEVLFRIAETVVFK